MDSYRHESDKDPVETREWLDSLRVRGRTRGRGARALLARARSRTDAIKVSPPCCRCNTDYVNTVRLEDQPPVPG